jgi:hypothetical protein
MDTIPAGQRIAQRLASLLPRRWDGKECVSELKIADYQWRQMEWIGWWFEYRAKRILKEMGADEGPEFGHVVFDCSFDGTWDFKSHPLGSGSGGWAYLNDESAVEACIRQGGHVGWIIAVGSAEYDEGGEFKAWHDRLKGEESDYVRQGRQVGRRSRRRKSAFTLEEIVWFEFRDVASLANAIRIGWMKRGMQQGQRNSGGTPRAPKFGFSHSRWRSYRDSAGIEVASGSVRVGG